MKNKKKTKIFKWIKDHVRPHFKWNTKPHDHDNELSWENIDDIKDNVKNNATVGIKFKWRF